MATLAALGIQALAYAVFWYRSKGQPLSPDGRFYLAMQAGEKVPSPYARRFLLPWAMRYLKSWSAVSGLAFIACGPLMYLLTGSLWCVWLFAWLPGIGVNVRFPVLVDQVALTLAIGAGALWAYGQPEAACLVLCLSGMVKESAPLFALALCPVVWMVPLALLSTAAAVRLGRERSIPGTQDYQLRPFQVARTKHDPLDWREMLLPWGAVAVLAGVAVPEPTLAWCMAGVSLLMGYGQLLLANDSVRLYQWAAPAVLAALAPLPVPGWMVPVLVAHPFICGAGKRV